MNARRQNKSVSTKQKKQRKNKKQTKERKATANKRPVIYVN